MKYIEVYKQCESLDELKRMAVRDAKVAMVWGYNPDRIKAIEDAMNTVAQLRGWNEFT